MPKRESVKEGFVPVLIKADDETLWECLILNSDPDRRRPGTTIPLTPDKVAEYREKGAVSTRQGRKGALWRN